MTPLYAGIAALAVLLMLYGLYRYITPSVSTTGYHANREHVPLTGLTSATSAPPVTELILFYVTWCPACKRAKPIWSQVRQEYQHKTIHGHALVFTEIDCDEDEAQRATYQVTSFPTIKMLVHGDILTFDAAVTHANLTAFINQEA